MDSTPTPDALASEATAGAEELAGAVAGLSVDERFDLLMGIAEECIQPDELRLLQNKPVPICYDGFEPSDRMHITQVPPPSLPSSSNLASEGRALSLSRLGQYYVPSRSI